MSILQHGTIIVVIIKTYIAKCVFLTDVANLQFVFKTCNPSLKTSKGIIWGGIL